MTKKEAKELSLEVWRYLAEHPKISEKCELPDTLYKKIKNMRGECPLCVLFIGQTFFDCPRCPLKNCGGNSFYREWVWGDKEVRKKAAEKIVETIRAWEPEED